MGSRPTRPTKTVHVINFNLMFTFVIAFVVVFFFLHLFFGIFQIALCSEVADVPSAVTSFLTSGVKTI